MAARPIVVPLGFTTAGVARIRGWANDVQMQLLPKFVDCLNQGADFLTPFSNLVPANTSAVNAGLGRPHKLWPWRGG
jgi:hypothetical protein